MYSRFRNFAVIAVSVALIAGACGSEDESSSASSVTAAATTAAPAATTSAPATDTSSGYPSHVDINNDGIITIAHVVHGDKNDGGYYQGQVDSLAAHAEANGWNYIAVDKVAPGAALETYQNLARGAADLIIAGGAEGTDGFIPIAGDPAFSAINYLMIAGFPPPTEFLSTAAASENQAHFMGGVAAGLLLERSGGSTACITGGPELPFVLNMKGSMLAGLAHAQENYSKAEDAELLITFTGDFEDAALALEAATAQFNQGCELIYPYLGGAMPAVWGAAAENGVGVVGTSMDLCGIPGLEFTTMSINYNPMYYLTALVDTFVAGDFVEGEQIAVYGVGDGLGIGANICDATDEEQQILDEVRSALADGSINVNELLGNTLGAALEEDSDLAAADDSVHGHGAEAWQDAIMNPVGAADDSLDPIVFTMANLEGDPIGSFPEIREGLEIAVEQINSDFGGIGGRPVDLEVCVHGFDPAAAINCGNEIGQTNPHLNINGIEFFTPALWPTFLGAGIPTIQTVPIFVADFTVEGNGYSVYGGCPVAFPGAASYTVEEMGYKKIAVLYAGTGPGLECFADTEERFWNQLGTEYELDWKGFPDASGDPTDNDANIQMMAEWFEGSPVEDRAVFFGMQASDCNEMLNAITAAGLETAVVSSGSCVDESVLSNPAAANSYFEHQSYIAERPDLYDAYSAWELGQREELLEASSIRTAPISTFLRVGYGAGAVAYQVLSDMIENGQDVDDRAAIIAAFGAMENQHVVGQTPTTCTNNTVEYPSVCKKTLTFVKWTGDAWDLGEFGGKIINVGDIQSRVANGEFSRSAADLSAFDANGDGEITIGIAAAGPADDGAYYQAVIDGVKQLSEENGLASPIVIDEIDPANAATELSNLADQGVDIIIVGASEIAEPLADLTEEYSDIFWYCNCGAGYPELPGLAQSLDVGTEVGYTTGYAAGLVLQERGDTAAAMLGCCDLNFEKEFLLSFEMGVKAVDSAFTVAYVPTGDFPYDFNSVANATEAFNNVVADGVGVVLPYLGGAHEPVVQLANDAGIAVSSAGASNVCDRNDGLSWDIAARFDGGDYVLAVFPEIFSGNLTEGQTKVFHVGVDPEPGGLICDATEAQQAAMDAAYAEVASGALNGEFGAIQGAAYGG